MRLILTISHSSSVTMAEVAFMLLLLAGVLVVIASMRVVKISRTRLIGAGALIAIAGALLIVATHWGRLFS